MHNLIEYSNNYSKKSGSWWQYYRDEPDDNIATSESFTSKIKIAGNWKIEEIGNSSFWRTLEMSLINCEINLILTCSVNFVISFAIAETKFKITDTKLYIP